MKEGFLDSMNQQTAWSRYRVADHQRASLPTFIVIGAMKCGTTSLHRYLDDHPEIGMSAHKETNFFIPEKNDKGVAWYCEQFDEDYAARGEVSPAYSKWHLYPDVPERMHMLLPEAKLIYLVRDPIERMISHYEHAQAAGYEHRTLSEALSDFDSNYVNTSRYFAQLKKYLEFYQKDNILVMSSEKLRNERAAALQEIFRFVGVDDSFYSPRYENSYHRSVRKQRGGLIEHLRGTKLLSIVRPFIPDIFKLLYRQIEDKTHKRPQLEAEVKSKLKEELAPGVKALRAFTGKRFTTWCL